jgi:hypothetical protein
MEKEANVKKTLAAILAYASMARAGDMAELGKTLEHVAPPLRSFPAVTWEHAAGSKVVRELAQDFEIDPNQYKVMAETLKTPTEVGEKYTINQIAEPIKPSTGFFGIVKGKSPLHIFKTVTKSSVGTGREQWLQDLNMDQVNAYKETKLRKGLLKKGNYNMWVKSFADELKKLASFKEILSDTIKNNTVRGLKSQIAKNEKLLETAYHNRNVFNYKILNDENISNVQAAMGATKHSETVEGLKDSIRNLDKQIQNLKIKRMQVANVITGGTAIGATALIKKHNNHK